MIHGSHPKWRLDFEMASVLLVMRGDRAARTAASRISQFPFEPGRRAPSTNRPLLSEIIVSNSVSADSQHTPESRLIMPSVETQITELEVVEDRRGNSFRFDTTAFVGNVRQARALIGAHDRLFQVIKGDGYGLGLERAVRLGLVADVDGFCVGTPEEATAALACANGKPVILFAACLPAELAAMARPELIVTVNTLDALGVVRLLDGQPFLLELDCGFGRFGLDDAALDQGLIDGLGSSCLGAYTHFGSHSFGQIDGGLERFDLMIAKLRNYLGDDILTMAAASHTMVWRPRLAYSAADPGRLLYGLLPSDLAPDYQPVVPHVAASILQINRVNRAQKLSIGYGSEVELPAGGRTGVFGLGWCDGLPTRAVGTVLVNGVRASVIGRTLLHSIVDLSEVPGDVAIGDEALLVGRQKDEAIDLAEAAELLGISPTEFHLKILNAIGRPPGATPLSDITR